MNYPIHLEMSEEYATEMIQTLHWWADQGSSQAAEPLHELADAIAQVNCGMFDMAGSSGGRYQVTSP